ncbi:MAG: HlyD family secretion protein [Polyangia bacterium]
MSAETEAKRAAARTRRLLIALGVLGALIYGGYRVYDWRQPYEWSGTVEARDISVGSRVGGRVKEVLAHEGARVKAGQALLQLEPGDLPAQRLQAKGQLDQAQANLDKLEKGARPEEIEQAKARALNAEAAFEQTRTGARSEQIAAAAARLSAQEVVTDKAKLDAERMRLLFSKGAASRAELDNAESNLRAAAAQRDALGQSLDELKNGSRREEVVQARARATEAKASERLIKAGSRVEDIEAARGQVEAAKGRLDSIDVALGELTIRAPRDAMVESLDLRPGDIVQPNATAAELLEEDQLYVRIYVPETHLGQIKLGQKVAVRVDSFPGKTFDGVVEHINGVGEFSPRNLQTADERADQVFATRVGLKQNGRDQLRAGMAAFIQVPK